jgi:hypothetical protein
MAKRIFLITMLILGCSLYTNQNESRATTSGNSDSDSATLNNSNAHKQRPAYRIINNRYVSRSSIQKSISHGNGLRIKLLLNGIDNTEIEDFNMAFDSGTEYRMGNVYGIENSSFPLYVKVTYRTWNTFHAVQSDVIYEFVIYSPGTWNVTICN